MTTIGTRTSRPVPGTPANSPRCVPVKVPSRTTASVPAILDARVERHVVQPVEHPADGLGTGPAHPARLVDEDGVRPKAARVVLVDIPFDGSEVFGDRVGRALHLMPPRAAIGGDACHN